MLRSVGAVVGGILVGPLVDRWLVFPAILYVASRLTPGAFEAHVGIYGAGMIILELGTATLCAGVTVGLIAPSRVRAHALAAGLLGGLVSLALGPAGRVPLIARVIGFAVQAALLVLIASRVAEWRARPRALPSAAA